MPAAYPVAGPATPGGRRATARHPGRVRSAHPDHYRGGHRDGPRRHQRVRPHRPQLLARGARAGDHDIEIVAVNDLGDNATLAHLLKYDSILGPLAREVEVTDDGIAVDGKELRILAERDPGALPWGDLGVDVVIESTGFFTNAADARKHVDRAAPRR